MGKTQRKSSEPAAPLNDLWVYVGLFLATFIVYFQVADFDFADYDDPQYIGNSHVCQGVTQEELRWAFTSSEAANWFPVTRLAHAGLSTVRPSEWGTSSHECDVSHASRTAALCISSECHGRSLAQRIRRVPVCAASPACRIRRLGR